MGELYHTNLMLHNPSAEYFQRPIILPFSFSIYDHCACWICLRNAVIELPFQAIRMLIILLYPFVRCGSLLVLNGGNGRGITHGVFGGARRAVAEKTSGPIEGVRLPKVDDLVRKGLS